ncbi:hypothetical protein PASE110613_01860 [Paenibacillus sediminis]|uniref:Uncharacterized protein n=1 Tax=Paenibacillus sediminis TaxID=664909 RepID=A0ABS4GZI0_9BACL|nr:hypothetical protein [Paenibacillus sediminis]MBP1935669.1 hypothetical protein [Paenibacillus sediminis]
MEGRNDVILMFLIGVTVVIILFYRLRGWSDENEASVLIPEMMPIREEEIFDHPALDILSDAGYEVLSGKMRIPILFDADGVQLHSRLYIDYLVSRDHATYMVKLARERRPVEWTGSAVRNEFLHYFLLYPECKGLLYVDVAQKEIKEVYLRMNDDEYEWYE